MLPKLKCQKILKCPKNQNLSHNQNSGDWHRSPWSCSPSTSRKKVSLKQRVTYKLELCSMLLLPSKATQILGWAI